MKALKLLAPSLVAVGIMAAPHDADAANANDEKKKASYSTFRDTAYTKRVTPERSWKGFAGFERLARPQMKTALHGSSFRDDAEPGASPGKGVPELSGSAAGASLALIGAGVLALTGRRKRKTRAQ